MSINNFYESPPGSGGNDGATPTVYDPNWQYYTNLTPNQIAWFSSQPQYLVSYAYAQRRQKETGVLGPQLTVAGMPVNTNDRAVADLANVAMTATRGATAVFHIAINGVVYTLSAVQALALFDNTNKFLNACRTVETQMVTGANATPPTITSTSQIDAAFAAIQTTY